MKQSGETDELKDEDRPRPSKHVTILEVEKVHNVVLRDWSVEVEENAKIVGMSNERVHHIMHAELGISKLSRTKKRVNFQRQFDAL